ncbi:hypothetical protein HPP92_012100 [Vanilla planifolia]|uniref:Uncharacterized protein n=1 Tax=Vanilla planifolia TaxID=51239 RepID=A0A835R8D0_VANPL|nr:hypothetical protein HPP92_012100 [Vanilla planifolia]
MSFKYLILPPFPFQADKQNLTLVASKKEEKPKDDETCKDLHNSRTNKNQQMTGYTKQPLAGNRPQIIQAQSIEQQGSSHELMIAGCGYHAYQHPGVLLPQQIHGLRNNNLVTCTFNTNPDCSEPAKPVEPPPKQIMTPQEKIEKLRWRQQKQAMLAIQQQREQYNHQNSFAEPTSLQPFNKSTIAMEQHGQKLTSSESSLVEQTQFPTTSTLIDDCIVEENIYHRLKFAMEKLNMAVRLSIRDSLYRLAQSSKERQNASDSNSTNRSNMEEENISADEESNQHDSHSRMHNLEAVTNPIDRVVAHLLFHTPSGSTLLHTADGNMSTTTST